MAAIKLLGFTVAILLSVQLVECKNKTSKEWAASAQKTIWETSQIFHRASIGLGSFDATTFPKLISLSKSASKVAGVFGVFGALFSIIMTFIPGGESPELKMMKMMNEEFSKLSEKVDVIAKSLDETKNLIKLEAQKSAYIKYENNIHNGYSQLQTCFKKLDSVSCSNIKECKRQKLLIAQGYINAMDVQESLAAIVRGVTSDSAFGKSLLDLLKDESACNIPKVNSFANKITALIVKGITVSIFHDLLTKTGYNVLDGTVLGDKMLRILESRRQTIQQRCLRNIDYWMPLDIEDAKKEFKTDIQATNTILLQKLKTKYPWIYWHVLTYRGEKEPIVGPPNSQRSLLFSSSKVYKVKAFVIPTNEAEVENMNRKIMQWKEIEKATGDDLSTKLQNIEHKIKIDLTLKNQVQAFAILEGDAWVLGHFKHEIKQHTLGTEDVVSANVFANRPRTGFVTAVSFKQADYPPKCSEPCNGKGKCFVYPYSTQTGCICNIGYTGEKCESSGTSSRLKSVINSLLQNTMKLPTFASIQHSIEDTQLNFKISTENIQNSIIALGDRIDKQFKSLGEFMSKNFDWYHVLEKYKDAIANLDYFHSISSEKITRLSENTNLDIANLTSKVNRNRFAMNEDKDIARFLLSPTGIQKWLYQINFLIMGRRDSQLNSHKPLIFLVMDKYGDRLCMPSYKADITRTYRQLMLLQLRGYMLWSNAYSIVNRDASVISDRYREVLKKQQKYLQGATCSANIPHSKLLQDCTGGYYIHKSMTVAVTCLNGYFASG